MTAAGKQTHTIRFDPNPTQKGFIESRAEADLFASRVGEGKSAALAWSAFYHQRHNPGAIAGLVRDTWDNMEKTTQREFFQWFPPGVMGSYQVSRKTFMWAPQLGGGEVQFMALDDPGDASKLQSRMFGFLGFDEPAPATDSGGIDELVFDIGLTRLRQPGMKWYGFKLAENNPDESHWTFKRFVDPGSPTFRCWQTKSPENERNLPESYYAKLRQQLSHRPDLVRRFLDGKFGFQQIGRQITPEWEDDRHLARELKHIPGLELYLLWDFGLNPTCIITQVTPLGGWHVYEAHVGEGIGAEELINDVVRPRVTGHYRRSALHHIGDPQGRQREQSSSKNSAVNTIKKILGGDWKDGPRQPDSLRIDPLRAVLRRSVQHHGLVQVDREQAKAVWHALRGGWHRHVTRGGLVGGVVKDINSHPGDAMGYGAAVLFPLSKVYSRGQASGRPQQARYGFGGHVAERPGMRVPPEGRTLG